MNLQAKTILIITIMGSLGNCHSDTIQFQRCYEQEPYTRLLAETLDKCVEICLKSTECEALVFEPKMRLCNIYAEEGTVKECPGKWLMTSGDISLTESDVCSSSGCEVKDCGPFPDPAGESRREGNQVFIGAKVKVTCLYNNSVHYVTCQDNGTWSTVPTCIADDGCPENFVRYGSACYGIFSSPTANWNDAQDLCLEHETGKLAEPHDLDAVEVLKTLLRNRTDYSPSIIFFWLGGNDIEQEGNWVWNSTGQPISDSSWGPDEPNNGVTENCIGMYKPMDYRFADIPCSAYGGYVCQISDLG